MCLICVSIQESGNQFTVFMGGGLSPLPPKLLNFDVLAKLKFKIFYKSIYTKENCKQKQKQILDNLYHFNNMEYV